MMTSESPRVRRQNLGTKDAWIGCAFFVVPGTATVCVLLFFANLFAPIELTERRLNSYRQRFEKNQDALRRLSTMILSEDRIRTVGPVLVDGVTTRSSYVAYHRIRTEWGGREWSNGRSLQDVLTEIGMPRDRYDAYVRALKRVDGRWVTRPTSRTVVVNLVSSGILTNAVGVDYLWAPDGIPTPRTPAYGEGDEVEFTPLSDEWYLRIQRD